MNFTHKPDEVVLDRYTIQRGIGMGGFGEVYFAVSQAGKEVALKRIQRNLSVELRGVSHCLNLKHPHLVSLHDICRDRDDQAWVVMEFVAGDNLREVLDSLEAKPTLGKGQRDSGTVSMNETERWFTGMAAGVAHLHSAGVVHRDLKPGNLFDDDGIIKIGDYGLSKFISSSHRGGHTESIGTFHYMAPEVGRGEYGCQIDLYAMGVILYELLSGQLPFDGETPQEILIKHLTQSPDLSIVPVEFHSVISACLQKDPANRPSSVASMMAMTPWGSEAIQPKVWPVKSSKNGGASVDDVPYAERVIPPAPKVTAPVTLTNPNNEEPVARALRNSANDLALWWRSLERSPGSKVFMIVATAAILLVNTHWLLPVLSMVAFCYVPYYIVRHMVLQISDPDTYAQNQDSMGADAKEPVSPPGVQNVASADVLPSLPRKLSRTEIRPLLRKSLGSRTRTTLAAEWATSGMTSMIFASVALLIGAVIGLRNSSLSPMSIAPYVWMAVVTWVGSAGLLAIGKAWESSEGEALVRRLIASGWGAAVGVVAYGLAQFMMVPLDMGLGRDIDATALPLSFYHDTGMPKAAAMMAHFAALFALLRMWKPVDPLRRTRLSLWAVTVAVVGEWIVHQVVPVPQPAGMLIAGGMVIMTQMSAPWVRSDSIAALS